MCRASMDSFTCVATIRGFGEGKGHLDFKKEGMVDLT